VEMTSVERERGAGSGPGNLWEQAVEAVIGGFETAFGVTTIPAASSVAELRPGAAVQAH